MPIHEVPSTDELRAAHDFAAPDEGAPCDSDRDCASPLRCSDATCLWPPAMSGATNQGTPSVEFSGSRLDPVRYHLEVADEGHELARGLMHRNSMVEDMGMIFIFDSDGPRSFWMRNTFIPLDMIFVTSEGVVDSFVENAEPRTDAPRPSDGAARYVIELNAGEVARMGLEPGSSVTLTGLPPEHSP
jgi:uncharacterized membrane protein (UPF0127 family)